MQAGRWGTIPALHCRGAIQPEQPWVSHGSQAPRPPPSHPVARQQRQRAFRVRHVAVGHRDIHSRLDLRAISLRVNAGLYISASGASSVHRQQRGARVRAAPQPLPGPSSCRRPSRCAASPRNGRRPAPRPARLGQWPRPAAGPSAARCPLRPAIFGAGQPMLMSIKSKRHFAAHIANKARRLGYITSAARRTAARRRGRVPPPPAIQPAGFLSPIVKSLCAHHLADGAYRLRGRRTGGASSCPSRRPSALKTRPLPETKSSQLHTRSTNFLDIWKKRSARKTPCRPAL